MTAAGIMEALGIKEYKVNPKQPRLEESLENLKKYGLTGSAERSDWAIGPYCDGNSCRIPYGVGVGNDNTPVSVFVSFRQDRITEINVSFSEVYWEEILPILEKKYGSNWSVERDQDMLITDLETKKSTKVERIALTSKKGGTNPKTNDSCQIWATNFDKIFEHHDPIGPYHSLLVIKLVSKNF